MKPKFPKPFDDNDEDDEDDNDFPEIKPEQIFEFEKFLSRKGYYPAKEICDGGGDDEGGEEDNTTSVLSKPEFSETINCSCPGFSVAVGSATLSFDQLAAKFSNIWINITHRPFFAQAYNFETKKPTGIG